MIKVDLNGFADVKKTISRVGKQASFAASKALNTTAFAVMRRGRDHISSGLDRPTRWTVSSWYVRRKATKTDLNASVGWSDYLANKSGNAADYYLAQQFKGGGRAHKAFENRLIRAGVMPAGMYAVPGKAAEEMGMMNGYGNMKAGVIVAILSAVQALSGPGSNGNAAGRKKWSANKRAAAQVYWAGKPGPNTPTGIWAMDEKFRKGRGRLRPVIIFVRKPNYKRRLDLDKIAEGVIARTFVPEFWKEFEAAQRTAR